MEIYETCYNGQQTLDWQKLNKNRLIYYQLNPVTISFQDLKSKWEKNLSLYVHDNVIFIVCRHSV